MNARGKLNIASFNGVLLAAGVAGWLFHSWDVFVIAGGLLLALALSAGSIRTAPTGRWR